MATSKWRIAAAEYSASFYSRVAINQEIMKQDIHPTYYQDAKIICACGTVHNIPSTVKEMRVELCSNCHPYYTGTAKFVDTAGRIDKFKEKVARAESARESKQVKDKVKAARRGEES